MLIHCSSRAGMGTLTITAHTAAGEHVLHESAPFPLDPKHPVTRAEIEWAREKTGVGFADQYDAIRAAMRTQRSAA